MIFIHSLIEGFFSVSQSLLARMSVWTEMQTHGFGQISFSVPTAGLLV